ncbi:hypothetical protein AALD22_01080 [Lachnospiraceae bacterium 56-18]|uniref:hypothetical protein n=1 Tax=Sporofaciens sp. JLR.KK001 TaxID=3112621 RepID=UPI002FF0F1E4
MENREELLMEILKRVQRNYRHMVEIERVTKEMADALSRNDQESAQLLMKMRQDELERFLDSKREIQMLIEVGGEDKEKLRSWLNAEGKYQPEAFGEKKILELSTQLQQVLKRTIDVDKVFNSRVAGKDSYYQAAH